MSGSVNGYYRLALSVNIYIGIRRCMRLAAAPPQVPLCSAAGTSAPSTFAITPTCASGPAKYLLYLLYSVSNGAVPLLML